MTAQAHRRRPGQGGGVRRWPAGAPSWFYALVSGGLFGTAMALFLHVREDPGWAEALIAGGLSGGFSGVVTGLFVARQRRELREAAGDEYEELVGLPVSGRRRALERRPELREAAARTLLRSREKLLRTRRWVVPSAVAFLVLEAWIALTRSPWLWAAVVLFAGILAAQFALPGWIDREVARLRAPRDDRPGNRSAGGSG